jgi:hypothetical protein
MVYKLRNKLPSELELRTGRNFWARPVVLRARPGPFALRLRPARPVVLRPGPFRAGKFRELSLKCLRIVFTCLFFTVISAFRDIFYCIIYVFIVLSMFRETFRKFSSLDRGKGNTRHRPRHTTRPTGNEPGRAVPGLNSGGRPGPGPARQENWNFQARPGPRAARPVLSSSRSVLKYIYIYILHFFIRSFCIVQTCVVPL